MSRRLRTALKWLARAFIVLALILAVPISALAFPQPFFDCSERFGHCVVYSDGEFTPGFDEVMRDVNRRLESVDVLPADGVNRVFLCNSQKLYSMLARLSRVNPNVQGFNLSLLGNTFVSIPRVNCTRLSSGGLPRYGVSEGSLAHVIAHEVAHDLTQNAMGFMNYYRDELLVEYLIEIEGHTFERIMSDEVTFDAAYAGMMDWYQRGGQ